MFYVLAEKIACSCYFERPKLLIVAHIFFSGEDWFYDTFQK